MPTVPALPYIQAAYTNRKLIAILVLAAALAVVSILLHLCKSAETKRETKTAFEGDGGTFRLTDPLTEDDITQKTEKSFLDAHRYGNTTTVSSNDTVVCRRLCDPAGIGDTNRAYMVKTTQFANNVVNHECICLRGQPTDGFLAKATQLLEQAATYDNNVTSIRFRHASSM